MTKLYEYEIRIDLAKEEGDYGYKEKTYAEHKYIGETKHQIAYVNSRWCGEQISTINKNEYEEKQQIGKIYTYDYEIGHSIKEVICNLISLEKLDKDTVFKNMEKEIKKYIEKNIIRKYKEINYDFSEVSLSERIDNNGDTKEEQVEA